jgi:hypothetical protein
VEAGRGKGKAREETLTHGNSAAISPDVRMSFDPAGHDPPVVIAVPLAAAAAVPSSCARRCTDCFVRVALSAVVLTREPLWDL